MARAIKLDKFNAVFKQIEEIDVTKYTEGELQELAVAMFDAHSVLSDKIRQQEYLKELAALQKKYGIK